MPKKCKEYFDEYMGYSIRCAAYGCVGNVIIYIAQVVINLVLMELKNTTNV